MQDTSHDTQAPNVPGFLSAKSGGDGVTQNGGKSVEGGVAREAQVASGQGKAQSGDRDEKAVLRDVIQKVKDAENVLVALSSDPSIDEIATALGLTTALDVAGKHVTAIYSGETPNVLEFLKPEETFETNTDSLQDFIIALNKDKADHLRYKVDGDFVKVYITPYRTTIDEDDLEFSRGDFNVDLVIGLNIPAATELDAALKEHGRIMNDATAVNITNGAAGKFGDVEWVNEKACSVAEMAAELMLNINKEMDEATATALLAGIVSATDKFTNQATTPEAMLLAAKLMKAGADQQEIIQNLSMELKFTARKSGDETEVEVASSDELNVRHDKGESEAKAENETEAKIEEQKSVSEQEVVGDGGGLTGALAMQMGKQDGEGQGETPAIVPKGLSLADKAAVNVSEVPETISGEVHAGATEADGRVPIGVQTPDPTAGMSEVSGGNSDGENIPIGYAPLDPNLTPPHDSNEDVPLGAMPSSMQGGALPGSMQAGAMPSSMTEAGTGGTMAEPIMTQGVTLQPIGETQPTGEANAGGETQPTDYGKMIDAALAEPMPGEAGATNLAGATDAMSGVVNEPMGSMASQPMNGGQGMMGMNNPAMMQAPEVGGGMPAGDVPAMDYSALPNNGMAMGQMNAGVVGGTAVGGGMTDGTPMGGMADGAMTGQMGGEMAGQVLPMPGQELAPPPMTPTPEFGTMPPGMPEMQPMPTMPQVDAGVAMQGGMAQDMTTQAQPGAFQIPGM